MQYGGGKKNQKMMHLYVDYDFLAEKHKVIN